MSRSGHTDGNISPKAPDRPVLAYRPPSLTLLGGPHLVLWVGPELAELPADDRPCPDPESLKMIRPLPPTPSVMIALIATPLTPRDG